jgi:predicted lipoprotein
MALLPLALLLAGPAAAQSTAGYQRLNTSLAEHHVIPRYAAFAEAAAALQRQVAAFCAAPSADGLAPTRGAYHAAVDAWMAVRHIQFGPIGHAQRSSRIQFWPDSHNTGSRQLGAMLGKKDKAAVAPEDFGKSSVAIQGFPAMERLLFSDTAAEQLTGGGAEAAFRCAFLGAIAGNLRAIAADVLQEWRDGDKPFLEVIATAAQGNDYYDDNQQVTLEYFKALHGLMQFVVDLRLMRPLGASLKGAKPRRAEDWRSSRSMRNIVISLQTAQAMFSGDGGFGFDGYLREVAGEAGLADQLTGAIAQTLATAQGISVPLDAAVADAQARPQVEALLTEAKALKTLFATRLTEAVDVPLGFNAFDGD